MDDTLVANYQCTVSACYRKIGIVKLCYFCFVCHTRLCSTHLNHAIFFLFSLCIVLNVKRCACMVFVIKRVIVLFFPARSPGPSNSASQSASPSMNPSASLSPSQGGSASQSMELRQRTAVLFSYRYQSLLKFHKTIECGYSCMFCCEIFFSPSFHNIYLAVGPP